MSSSLGKKIEEFEKRGCNEEDILSLLRAFEGEWLRVDGAFKGITNNRTELKIEQQLKRFIEKCEVIVDSELATLQEYIQIATSTKHQKTITLQQFEDSIMQWADVIWTERQEEHNANFDLDVTDRLDERPDLSMDDTAPAPRGEFNEDPILEVLKDQVYKQRQ